MDTATNCYLTLLLWLQNLSHDLVLFLASICNGSIDPFISENPQPQEFGFSHSFLGYLLSHSCSLTIKSSSRFWISHIFGWLSHLASLSLTFSFFFHFSFIIHMCIQGLVHFSPLPPPPPLPPTPPPPSPPQYPAETILPLFLILL
jgi:hypothetical protein